MRILQVDVEGQKRSGVGPHQWRWTARRNGHVMAESGRWHASKARALESLRLTLRGPYEVRVWRDGDLLTAKYQGGDQGAAVHERGSG